MTERLDLPRRYWEQIEALCVSTCPVWRCGPTVAASAGREPQGQLLGLSAQRPGLEADTQRPTGRSD